MPRLSLRFIRLALLAGIAFAAAGAPTARAQDCVNGTLLSPSEIASLLNGRWACGHSAQESWNEQISGGSGGTVTEYAKGPSDANDPTHQVGTFSITGTTIGTITYSYGVGGTYAYRIRAPGAASTAPGTYSFCGVNGSANWSITVNNSAASCAP